MTPTPKAVVIKSIRLANNRPATGTGVVKVSLFYSRPAGNSQAWRRLISPRDFELPDGFAYVDNTEITLEPGDSIQALVNVANVIDYVLSGVERTLTAS